MGIQVQWDNDHYTIQRYCFESNWTWEDFYHAKQTGDAALNEVRHPVGVIFEAPADVQLPPNFLSKAYGLVRSKHPNATMIVIVGTSLMMRGLISAMTRLSSDASLFIRVVPTLEEARSIINQIFETVQDDAYLR